MDFNLRSQTCLMVVAGSRSYGMATETSDVDIKGFALAPQSFYLGYRNSFEQRDSSQHMASFLEDLTKEEQDVSRKEKLEGSIYEMKKFLSLATDNNPNILETLFVDDEHVRICNWVGDLLRENKDLFLSTKVRWSFSGYAASQMKRIETHRRWLLNPKTIKPTRADFNLPERTVIPEDQLAATWAAIEKEIDSWELDLSAIPTDADRLHFIDKHKAIVQKILQGDEKWKRAGRSIDISDNMLLLLDNERKYNSAMNDWKSYQHWLKTRNPKRAALEEKYLYDCKHGAQLVRLTRTCKEFLLTKKINVNRSKIDGEELLLIKNGGWTYEKLKEYFTKEEQEIEELYRKNEIKIPRQPDVEKIDAMCIGIMAQYLGGKAL